MWWSNAELLSLWWYSREMQPSGKEIQLISLNLMLIQIKGEEEIEKGKTLFTKVGLK